MTMMAIPEHIAIVGEPVAGCATALAVRAALPKAQISLIVWQVGQPSFTETIGAAGAGMARFHEAIGIDHHRLASQIGGIPDHGVHLVNWPGASGGFTIRRGHGLQFVDGLATHQLWLRLAKAGVLTRKRWDALGTPPQLNGLRFDPARYARLLGELLGKAQIAVGSASNIDVKLADPETISAVESDAGHHVEADLFIDCTGPHAVLVNAVGGAFSPWQEMPALALTGIGSGRTANDSVQNVGTIPGAYVVDTGVASFRLAETGSAEPCGARQQSWLGNVICVGEAAMRVPPLGGHHYEALYADLVRLCRLLGSGTTATLRSEFLRQTAQCQNFMRDWSAAFWLHDDKPLPDGLAHILAEWGRRGRSPVRDGDPVAKGEWVDLLIGLGRYPERIDPTLSGLSDDDVLQRLSA